MRRLFEYIGSIKIRENSIYYLIFIFVYGIYGAGTDSVNTSNYFFLLFPIIIFPFVIFSIKTNDVIIDFKDYINIFVFKKNFFIFLFFFLLLFFLTFEKITLNISDDEIAYTSLGLIHSNFLIKKISNIEYFDNLNISLFYQIISLCVFLSAPVFLFLTKSIFKNKYIFKFITISVLVLLLRIVIFESNGNPFPHPTLVGLIPLLSVSIFGLSDFFLKLSTLFIFSFFCFFIFKKFQIYSNTLNALIITIALFSIPGFSYLGISIEQALWSTICYTIVLFQITEKPEPDFKKIFITILFFSFFRILSLTSVLIIFFYVLYNSETIKKFFQKSYEISKNSYPLLLILPFISFSFINKSNITINRVGFEFIEMNFLTQKLPSIIIDSFTIPFSIFLLLLFLVSFLLIKKTLLLLSFTIFQIIIYGQVIVFNNKYNYEVFIPFLIFVLYLILKKKIKNFRILIVSISFLLIFSNLSILKNIYSYCKITENPLTEAHTFKHKFGCRIHDAHPFNLTDGYNFLKKINKFSFKNLYVPGVYYGVLPSVINGMKVNEYKQHIDIYKQQNIYNQQNNVDWHTADTKSIHGDKRIQYVLIADLSHSRKIINELKEIGWKEIFNKTEKTFLTQTIILARKN